MEMAKMLWVLQGKIRSAIIHFYKIYVNIAYSLIRFSLRLRSPKIIVIKLFSFARRHFSFLKPIYHSLPILQGAVNKLYSKHVSVNRYYLRKDITPIDFFSALNESGENYLMLRWWDGISNWDNSEDLDILVDAPDVELWHSLIQHTPSSYKLDIYTDKGDLSANGGVPYFPPKIFARLLANRIMHKDLVYRPSDEDSFLAILFHMFFHKGAMSGLSFQGAPAQEIDERYLSFLNNSEYFQERLQNFNAGACFDILAENDFLPAEDLMLKYAEKRPEIKEFIRTKKFDGYERMFLIYVREAYSSEQTLSVIKSTLVREGYSVLFTENIKQSEIKLITENIRGGNWGRGGFAVSSGGPSSWILALDRREIPDVRAYFKRRQNVKEFIRKELIVKSPLKDKGNPVHSADSGEEIKQALELIASENCRQTLREIVAAIDNPEAKIKFGRIRTTWLDNTTLTINKFFNVDMETFINQERQAFTILEHNNFACNGHKRDNRLFSYPLFENSDEESVLTASNLSHFFEVLYLNKLVIPDLSWEQFAINSDGLIHLVDAKYVFQVETEKEWRLWYNNGILKFRKYRRHPMPIGYATSAHLQQHTKFSNLKLKWDSENS